MSGVGGVIGILAGILFDLRLRGSRDGRWCFRCRPSIAVTVSAAVGVFFDCIPRRAASL